MVISRRFSSIMPRMAHSSVPRSMLTTTMVYTTISKFEISTLRSANFLRGWWRSQWRSQWVVWVEMGRMGRVGKREHHLTARQCKAQGSNNADNAQPSDARPRSGLSCLYCHSRPKITRDPRDEKDERDDSEVADKPHDLFPLITLKNP